MRVRPDGKFQLRLGWVLMSLALVATVYLLLPSDLSTGWSLAKTLACLLAGISFTAALTMFVTGWVVEAISFLPDHNGQPVELTLGEADEAVEINRH